MLGRMGEMDLCCAERMNQSLQPLWNSVQGFLIQAELQYEPLLGIYPMEVAFYCTDTRTPMLISALLTIFRKWYQLRQSMKMCYLHTVGFILFCLIFNYFLFPYVCVYDVHACVDTFLYDCGCMLASVGFMCMPVKAQVLSKTLPQMLYHYIL